LDKGWRTGGENSGAVIGGGGKGLPLSGKAGGKPKVHGYGSCRGMVQKEARILDAEREVGRGKGVSL